MDLPKQELGNTTLGVFKVYAVSLYYRSDGCCKHVAAMLWELVTFMEGQATSCTDVPMMWTKKPKPEDSACPFNEISLGEKRYATYLHVCVLPIKDPGTGLLSFTREA